MSAKKASYSSTEALVATAALVVSVTYWFRLSVAISHVSAKRPFSVFI